MGLVHRDIEASKIVHIGLLFQTGAYPILASAEELRSITRC